MKSKKQYRFKTEAEFKAEFGEDWRWKIPYSFVEDMDHFLGTPYRNEMIPSPNGSWNASVRYEGWTIGLDMLTTRRLPKILADGTIAKVGMKVLWLQSIFQHTGIINRIYLEDKDVNNILIACTCGLCNGINTWNVNICDVKKYVKPIPVPSEECTTQ